MDDSQRDTERGEILQQLRYVDKRLGTIESKVDMLCVDSSRRQRECWEELNSRLVSKAEFAPVQKIVYGAVGIICVAVITGVLAVVIKVS